jgi:phage tail sheath gpL-like
MATLAVSPGTLTPGFYLSVNLIAGSGAPSVGDLRVLLLTPKASTGDLTVDTEIRPGEGADSAAVAYGVGSLGNLMAQKLYEKFPTAQIDFGAPTAGSGTATKTVTFTGSPTGNNVVEVSVAGRVFQEAWLAGESASDIRDKVVARLLAETHRLPTTAAAGSTGAFSISSKVTGVVGNDIKVRVRLLYPATGTEASDSGTFANLTGGTTDASFVDILAAAQGREYHYIVLGISNADAVDTTSSSNVERAIVHVKAYNNGLNAKLQQIIYATTGSLSAAIPGAIARNEGFVQHFHCTNAQGLPGEWAAAEAGDRLRAVSLDPAANRIGNVLIGTDLYGSANINADKPTPAQCETAIAAGITIASYSANDDVFVVRPVTTYSQSQTGSPDRRLLDVQNVDATYIVARDLRSALPAEFPNAKITKDVPAGGELPPAGVIEERDIKAFVISRLRSWQRSGVVLGSALDTVIANGELSVRVNDSDPTQVDIFVPISIVPPLAKFGTVVNRNPV